MITQKDSYITWNGRIYFVSWEVMNLFHKKRGEVITDEADFWTIIGANGLHLCERSEQILDVCKPEKLN